MSIKATVAVNITIDEIPGWNHSTTVKQLIDSARGRAEKKVAEALNVKGIKYTNIRVKNVSVSESDLD